MTRRRAIEMLQEYQRWRRGEPLLHWKEGKKTPTFPYSSQMLGQAIDRAIEALEIVKGRRCQPLKKGK